MRQLVERGAARQVGGVGGVAEHDVRAAVDELADAVGDAVDRPQLEVAAGDRPADRAGVAGGERRREVRHPGRRLGLAVHHVEVDAPAGGALAPRLQALRRHAPPGLGHEAQ